MTSDLYPLKDVEADAFINLTSLTEDQRVAFYRSLFALAAADGAFKEDELDVIFETIDTHGLSERAKSTVWHSIIDVPSVADCTAILATASDQVRCALMVYLIELALTDNILDVNEDDALLQARQALRISQKQIQAIERCICEGGLIRPRPRDYQKPTRSRKRIAAVLTALSIPATAVYVSRLMGGASATEITAGLIAYSTNAGIMVGVGATLLIGTSACLAGLLLKTRGRRRQVALRRKRRRRACLAMRNLQDAIGYLTAKKHGLVPAGASVEADRDTPLVLTARLRVLQRMLAQRLHGDDMVVIAGEERASLVGRRKATALRHRSGWHGLAVVSRFFTGLASDR